MDVSENYLEVPYVYHAGLGSWERIILATAALMATASPFSTARSANFSPSTIQHASNTLHM